MSDVNKVPSVYNFLYQPVAAEGESEKPAEKFLLGFDNEKYYLHNGLDYSDAAVSLKPGTSFTLETPNIELNASSSIIISNGVKTNNILQQYVQFANSCLNIYDYSFQIAPNNAKAVPSFYVNATRVTLQSASDFNFQSPNGILNFVSGKTGKNQWCSAVCFKTTDTTYSAAYIGVYKDNDGTPICAFDAKKKGEVGEVNAPLAIGLQSSSVSLGASGYDYLVVGPKKTDNATEEKYSAYIRRDQNSWSEIASRADISGMLVNKNNWEVLEEINSSSGTGWCSIQPGIYLIEVYDSNQTRYEGYTPLGAIEIATGKAIVQNFNLTNIDNDSGRKYNIKNCILQKALSNNYIRVVEYNNNDKVSEYNPANKIRVKKLA